MDGRTDGRTEGGDLKFINGSLGLSGCSATCPCAWCIKKRSEFGDDTIGIARTWAMIEELAHQAPTPFTCPGCKTKFNTEDEADEYDDSNGRQYQKDHYGVNPGLCPLPRIISGPSITGEALIAGALAQPQACMLHVGLPHFKRSESFCRENPTLHFLHLLQSRILGSRPPYPCARGAGS